MDLAGIYAPFRQSGLLTALLAPFLFAAAAIAVLLLWREREDRFLRRRHAFEKEQTALIERLEALNRFATDSVLVADHSGQILDASERAIASYGYDRRDLLRLTMSRLVPRSARPDFERQWARLVEENGLVWESEHQRKDSSTFPVEIAASLVDFKGNMCCQSVVRDISERKRADARFEEANKELEAFAYSVSHDLRAPLRALDGFSRILLEEYAPQLPIEAQHYVDVVRRNALKMGELIDGLLKFSRLSRQPLSQQSVALANLARQAWEELRSEPDGRNVEITIGELASCQGDALMLKQVFLDLLSNALKYTRAREIARIEVGGTAGDSPAYFVRDNGVGFDMHYADKLFGVFQRLHRAEDYEGAGVGLAAVQRIIHRHGGKVWADSVLNEGATFYFTLPGAAMPPERNGNAA